MSAISTQLQPVSEAAPPAIYHASPEAAATRAFAYTSHLPPCIFWGVNSVSFWGVMSMAWLSGALLSQPKSSSWCCTSSTPTLLDDVA